MARFVDILTDQNLVPLEGATVTVQDGAGNLASLTADGGAPLVNPFVIGATGAVVFNASDAVYTVTYRYGGRVVRQNDEIVGTPAAFVGPAGGSNNTRASLAQLKAAATTDLTSLYDGSLWNWRLGNYTGKADDLTVVKADSTAISTGANVRITSKAMPLTVGDYGAGSTANDTSAIQAAVSADPSIAFPPRTYAANVTTSTGNIRASTIGGAAVVGKAINGAAWNHSGNYGRFSNLFFDGSGFTGENVNLTGGETDLIHCNSQGAASEALKSTGGVHVWGGVYATTNATQSFPDIRLGVSGTATLYSTFQGVRTTQRYHGLYEIDTGSTSRIGCQFGNVIIDTSNAASPPAGINGGNTLGCRVTDNYICNVSNGIAVGDLIGGDIEFGLNTSGNVLTGNGITANGRVNNLGNTSQWIMVNRGDGSSSNAFGGIRLCFGASHPADYNNGAVPARAAAGAGGELWLTGGINTGRPDPTSGIVGTPGYMLSGYSRGFQSLGSDGSTRYTLAVVYATDGSTQFGHSIGAATTALACGTGGFTLTNGTQSAKIFVGAGVPAVSASVGSLYLRTDGGANTTLYVKESGTGASGWIAK